VGEVPLAPPSAEEQALARAYAALGAAESGDGRLLAALDPPAQARLDEARPLLAVSAPRARSAPAGAADGRGTAAAGALAPIAREEGGGSAGATAPAPAGAEAAVGLRPTAMALDLAHAVDPRRALRDSPEGPELLAPGLWAKVPFRPDR